MIRPRIVAGILIALMVSLAPVAEVRADDAAQAVVESIVTEIKERRVGRVEIINVPAYILNVAAYGPEDLERVYTYKFIIADLRGSAYASGLQEALATMEVARTDDYGDLRWGLIFLDLDDNRLGAIYLDGWGKRGVVNSTPVTIDGELYLWLLQRFSKVFK